MTDPDTSSSLDEILAVRAREMAAKARRSGGRLDAEDRAEVQAMAQIQQMLALQRPRRAAPRWPIALTLGAALAAATALMVLRVNRTPIELETEASAVRIVLSRAQPITGTMALAGLRAVGVQDGDAGDANQPVVLSAGPGTDAGCQASLTLEPLMLPAGAQLTLRASAQPTRLRVTVLAPGAMLRLSQAQCAGNGQARQTRNVMLTFGAEEADLELETSATPLALTPVIAVQGLALDDVETLSGTAETHVRRVSTLLSAQLHRLALDGPALVLRRGEMLELYKPAGDLRELEARAGALQLRFAGEVQALARGDGEHARNLMPTWLQWLRANQSLILVWGSGLTIFGLATTLNRWWRGH